VLAIVLALAGGAEFNVSVLVGLAFCFASSVTFPGLLLALWWRRFNTMGAIVGMLTGLISSIVLIGLSAPVWPGSDTTVGSPLGSLGLENPAIFTIPLAFLGCWLGTVLSSEHGNKHNYDELYVRSETGLGAEGAEPPRVRPRRREAAREPVGAR
jgi:cation/acetate symporter